MTFGTGPNNDKLYITTASTEIYGGSLEQQAKYPDSGHLFEVDFAGRFKGGKWRGEFP